MTYRELRDNWENSPLCHAARVLISIKKDSGTWLWFEDTVQAYDIDLDNCNAGELARAMLVWKLGDLYRITHMAENK